MIRCSKKTLIAFVHSVDQLELSVQLFNTSQIIKITKPNFTDLIIDINYQEFHSIEKKKPNESLYLTSLKFKSDNSIHDVNQRLIFITSRVPKDQKFM